MAEDKVLLFLMLNGAQMASEGILDRHYIVGAVGGWYEATHVKTGEHFLINLGSVASIISVDRSKVLTGPVKVVMPPEGGLN